MSLHELGNDVPFNDDDIIIAVMGITGSGKSTFISKSVDTKITIGHQLQSCTSDVRPYGFLHHTGRRVFLLDTPGFDDTYRSDTDVLKTISGDLAMMYSKDIKLSGIIYLHRITDVRFSGSAHKNLSVFKKLCGDKFYPNVVLAKTMWENLGSSGLSTTISDQREKELRETSEWWGLMIGRGSKTFRHTDDRGSAMQIVDYLIGLRKRAALEIQTQLIDEGKSRQDTTAGMEVEREMQQAKVKFAKDLKELKYEQRQTLLDRDDEVAEMLRKQAEKTDEAIQRAEKSQQDLKIGWQQLLAASEHRNNQFMQQLQQQLQEKERDYRSRERRFDDERRANEARHRQRVEELERERRVHEKAQRQRDEAFAAQQERYQDLQRRDAGMVSERQQLQSTISGLQEQVSGLAARNHSNHSSPLHSPTPSDFTWSPSPPGSPECGSDDDDPSADLPHDSDDSDDDQFNADDVLDYDEDWKIEEYKKKASNDNALANGGPLLLAVAGVARVGPSGAITGTLVMNRTQ